MNKVKRFSFIFLCILFFSCKSSQIEKKEVVEQVVVPSVPHSYGEWTQTSSPTCTTDGEEVRTCACGASEKRTVPSTGHKYSAVITPPTQTEEGYTTYTCTCGDTYKGDIVPPTGSEGLEYSVNSDGKTCTITSIGTCKDTDVVIPSTIDGYKVISIGYRAFYNCTSLTSITIPDSVTSIGNDAFRKCTSLTSITIPDSVTTIGAAAFYYCTSLTSVTVDSNNEYYSSDEYGVLFNKDKTELIRYPIGNKRTSYTILNVVTKIGEFAFADCVNLTNVIIGDNVKIIGNHAFSSCDKLTSAIIPDSVTTIGDYAFSSCYNSLTKVVIGDSVTTIGEFAFRNCYGLTSITIPESVTTIGGYAFYQCYNLSNIKLSNKAMTIGNDAFADTAYYNNASNWVDDELYINNYLIKTNNKSGEYIVKDGIIGIAGGAFSANTNLTSVTIPDSVITIGRFAFSECTSLTKVTIGNGVKIIGYGAFSSCTNLTDITLSNSLTTIDSYAFKECTSLNNIIIPSSVTTIGEDAFYKCTSLTSIIIPNGVTKIGRNVFFCCTSLKSFTIPNSVTEIGNHAFYKCNSLTDVYYGGTEEQWNKITIGYGNECLTNATIHYNSTGPDNPSEPDDTNSYIKISQDIVFIDIGEHYQFSAYNERGVDVTANVSWTTDTDNETIGKIEIASPGEIVGVNEGLTHVYANGWWSENSEFWGYDDCYVYVGNLNEINYESIYDQIYYYGENAFYSDACQFSNSVDIYILLDNIVKEDVRKNLYYVNDVEDELTEKLSTLDIGEYTIYASVDGANLSFDKDKYINNYVATYDNIPIDKAVDELLTLYPYNLDVSASDKSFTVSLRIESDDFETIYDSFSFKISSLEDKAVNEHISFINNNGAYRAMRDADFATGMTDLKNDSQYIWSKYSTFDFENYYEILMADVLVQLMGIQLTGNISLLPALKEWKSNYDTILDNVSTIVEDDYTGYLNITENSLDKLFKKSKYVTQPDIVNDEIRDTVIDLLGKSANTEKINKAFGAIDKTGQVIDFLDFGVNIGNDIIDYVNCISIMNSYKNMNDEFKNVIKKVYDCIPNTDWNVKEAVNHYVNLDTSAGYTEEIVKSAIDLAKNITLEAFNSLFKTQFVSIFTNAIGSIKLASGALLSSTTAFSTITTGLSAVATGATLGLCISDILCDNSGQAEEMGKVVAASAFAPYIIQTLKYYEWALKEYKDESSLKHFEIAFKLNKTLQIYSIEHTYKALEIQANSIIIKLFSNLDYPGAMTELAALKTMHENCNCCEDVSTAVVRTKTIAVKCPVNVYLYDENGNEVVRIINNIIEYCAPGITVFVNGSEKYITVPADQEYRIKIIATETGKMTYSVTEYDEYANASKIVLTDDIPLSVNKEFTGKIDEKFSNNANSYALITNGTSILPTQQISVPATRIDISKTKIELDKDELCQLTAIVSPENATNKMVYWSSSNSNVATVSENGLITAVGGGTAIITAHTVDGVIATCEVSVIDFTFNIQIPSRTEIRHKDGIKLHANIEGTAPAGSYVVWIADNNKFKTEEINNGDSLQIISDKNGYTTITATLYDADGEILATDEIEMRSKAGFFDKIGSFFRSLFGGTKIYEN